VIDGLPLAGAASGAAVGRLADVWVYLSASPLLGLTITLLVYQAAFVAYRRSGFHPLANPVALSVVVLGALLWVSDTAYATYF
jgi:putative effector of murein hydrolase